MQILQVLAQLQAERDRIQAAINALSALGAPGTSGTVTTTNSRRKRRAMSAEAHRKISEAQKKRWAARKKAA